MAKYIFVTGGVVSSLGKGITAASLGMLLKARGYKVILQKFDPYLNVDPGTMNPYQHGEVFVTQDGAETDLDLGHYERFLDTPLTRRSSVSSGQVYQSVINKERRGDYNGGTVQVIPHITNEIRSRIVQAGDRADIVISEIGGTVGDIEGQPFLEAIRQMHFALPEEDVLYMHVTLVPYLTASHELKTKPTQHSVKELQKSGIQPDYLICRCDYPVPDAMREKIALFCNVRPDHVIENTNCDSLYEVPLMLEQSHLAELICRDLHIENRDCDLTAWEAMVHRHLNPEHHVKITLVGKYVALHDAFLSVVESLTHGGIAHNTGVEIKWIASDDLDDSNVAQLLGDVDGVLVPGGFGTRGIEGKITAVRYAREHKIPFFGICMGMQTAMIEMARHMAGLTGANSTEVDADTPYPVVDRMPDQTSVLLGGTMRLGAYDCDLEPGTKIYAAYGAPRISERHRHRYEVNNDYIAALEEVGVVFSGHNPESGLVEALELRDHPWFVGVQYHPEFQSRPNRPHPLFRDFVGASLAYQARRRGQELPQAEPV
ncbi:MAG: CTP synthase [Oscillospiraceae bacterium]|nr:CTP synthase [Oscillospiraceae bacterium]MDD4367339.1 CTP synthase [Oscillospiraceae bacterium]